MNRAAKGTYMTWFDLLLILILVLSIGFAAVRGAIRELATLFALALAALVAYLLFNPLLGTFGLKGSVFGMAGLAAVLLGVFFLVFYTAGHIGLKRLHFSRKMRLADRIGGASFGLLRGLALIGLGFLGYAYYQDQNNRPDAINDAMLLPVAESAANFFEGLAPKHDSQDIITPDQIKDEVNAADAGYARGDRAALNEIMTTATTSDVAIANDTPAPSETDQIASILNEDENGGQ